MTNSIIFVDASVIDPQILLSGIDPYAEIHFLNANEDGVLQISNTLRGRTGLDAIHIVSHGSAGSLSLGNTELNDRTLATYQDDLWGMGASLSKSGDILLYGCNIAKDKTGLNFTRKLSQYTGADIAASNNLTGKASLGGDWNLEVQIGTVSASQLFTAESVAAWGHTLIAPTENNDSLTGTNEDDQIDGLGGDDRIIGLDGNDTLSGGNGNDTVFGGNGNDSLADGDGADFLYGGDGNDTLNLGVGDSDLDSVFGDAGDDLIIFGNGQHGIDTIDGGGGTNTFQFASNAFGNFFLRNTGGTGVFIFAASGATFDPNDIGGPQIVFDASGAPGDELVVTLLDDDVNEAPSFTVGIDQTVNEDAGAQIVNDFATNISPGPADELGQNLTFNVSNNNNALFAVQPSIDPTTGNLTYTPVANANGSGTVTVTLSDNGGTSNGGVDTSASQTFTIAITPVNDAPINTIPTGQVTDEDTAVVFSSGNGNLISISDIDAGTNPVQVSLSVTNGILTLSGIAGLNIVGGSNGSDSFTIQGTVANINTALNGLTYLGNSNYSGPDSLMLITDDLGNTGSGGTATDTDLITITLNEVNDPPSITSAATGTVAENAPITTVVYDAKATDPDTTAPNNSLSFSLSGADASLFTIDADDGELRLNSSANFEAKNSYSLNVVVTDAGNGNLTDIKAITVSVTDVNEAPTAVNLQNETTSSQNITASLPENTSTANRIKVADIAITDDALGTEAIALTGTDAAFFEVVGTELFLKANTVLNFEAKTSYSVTVDVDDPTVGNTPDGTANFTLTITDVNEAPTVVLNNQLTFLEENTDTTNRLKVADITITDDALGSNSLGLSGADAALFEIIGTELFIKAGTNLDFETNPVLDVIVEVDDPTIGTTPDNGALFSLTLTNVSEIDGNNSGNFLFGTRQKDLMQGVGGNDILFGNGGNDTAYGGQGLDYLDGGIGDDILLGGEGNDTALGGSGNDVLIGGVGADQLSGGLGRDQFVYNALDEAGDFIYDFNPIQDRLVLTELFKSIGYTGRNPIADGLLRFTPVQFSPTQPGTLVQIDPNGLTDGLNYTILTSLLGVFPTSFSLGTNVII